MKKFSRCWEAYQWPVIIGLGVTTVILGHIGFAKYMAAIDSGITGWDSFYLALQLFTLESAAVTGELPWQIQIARLTAPAVLFYTAIKALLVIFQEQLQLFRVRFVRQHVIICGLGDMGQLLVKGFRKRGYQVVAIELDRDLGKIHFARDQGAIVLTGNAADSIMLRRARVHKAQYIFAVCGEDGTGAEVAVHAREICRARRGSVLICYVHISDYELACVLREKEIATQKLGNFRLELFHIMERGAQALLTDYPGFRDSLEQKNIPPHLVIVGLGRLGEILVIQAARVWHTLHRGEGKPLRITVVDKLGATKMQMLYSRYPQLEKNIELQVHELDIRLPQFRHAEFLNNENGLIDVTSIYVCLSDDCRSLSAALAIRRQFRRQKIPIILRMRQDAGLAILVEGEQCTDFDNLFIFALLDQTCSPDIMLGGTNEMLARTMHEDYLRKQINNGQTAESSPSLVSWDDLPENLKNSNRHQADHISIKLEEANCGIEPLTDWNQELFRFNEEEIERLSIMEHDRWVEERRQDGWIPGEKKNAEKKISPYLVSWDKLEENIKQYDREFVIELPRFLAKAGFVIYRLGS